MKGPFQPLQYFVHVRWPPAPRHMIFKCTCPARPSPRGRLGGRIAAACMAAGERAARFDLSVDMLISERWRAIRMVCVWERPQIPTARANSVTLKPNSNIVHSTQRARQCCSAQSGGDRTIRARGSRWRHVEPKRELRAFRSQWNETKRWQAVEAHGPSQSP